MATRVSQRRAMSTEERRREIIVRAAALFDRDGYSNTSMEGISLGLDIAKPTLYHYFRSKEEILRSIHEEFITMILADFERRIDAEASPTEQLLGAMTDILRLMDSHRGYVRVFFEHHRELPADARRKVRVKRDRYEGYVRSAIEAGVAEGTFREVDPKITAMALFGMCNWSYQWYQSGGQFTSEQVATQLWDLLLAGITSDAAPPTGAARRSRRPSARGAAR